VDILYLLVPLSVVLVFIIGVVFWMALRSGQFDDLEGPGFKILLDDDTAQSTANSTANSTAQSTDKSTDKSGAGGTREP
jgi:cbb3-type cytochrome oxidase maturation protein